MKGLCGYLHSLAVDVSEDVQKVLDGILLIYAQEAHC